MRTIIDEALALFKSHAKQTAKITVTPKSGNKFFLTESDILANGFNINRSSVSGESIELGSVIASELGLTLENNDARFQNSAFEGARLAVSVSVTEDSAEYSVDFGCFNVDEVSKGQNSIVLTALDDMVKFDKEVELNFFTDNLSNKTVSDLVKKICYTCSVELKTDLSTLVNSDYVIASIPQTSGLTYRQLLSWCCQIMGVCAHMDFDGSLVLRWYSESGVEISDSDRYDSTISENPIALNKLKVMVADKTYTSGTGNYAIDLSGNMLIQVNPQEMLDSLYSAVGGLTYLPFTAVTIPLPQIEPLDKIKITVKGSTYPTIVTNWSFSLNNSTNVVGQGTGETKKRYASVPSFTSSQAFVLEQNKSELKTEIDSKIEQTRTSILLEVGGKYATGEEVRSAIQLTNNAIESEVSRAKGAESSLSSRIAQTENSISLMVTKQELSGTVSSEVSSQISVAQDNILLEVSNNYATKTDVGTVEASLSSQIQQNADAISLRVTRDDLSSAIEQSAEAIRLKADKISWQSTYSSMTEDGRLTVKDANITGVITAEEGGNIAGFDIKENMLSYDGDDLNASFLICPDSKNGEGIYMDFTIGNYTVEDVVFKIGNNFAIGKTGSVVASALGCISLTVNTLTLSEYGKIDFKGTLTDQTLGRYVGWAKTLETTGIIGTFNLVENIYYDILEVPKGEYQMTDVMQLLLSGENVVCSFAARIKRIEERLGISDSYIQVS